MHLIYHINGHSKVNSLRFTINIFVSPSSCDVSKLNCIIMYLSSTVIMILKDRNSLYIKINFHNSVEVKLFKVKRNEFVILCILHLHLNLCQYNSCLLAYITSS